ncbi:MAG: hypothetical protein HGN29_08075 [Asgard group archaeon]|nr:hypothetical protein [Asgard group archaeon]
MSKFSLSIDSTEEKVKDNLDMLMKLSTVKASKMLRELGVFEILNRPRSPEEIFHMLNFNTLEDEFFCIFDLLVNQELITKQGEFYADSPRRKYLEETLETEVEQAKEIVHKPFNALLDKSVQKYKAILKGEQGKLDDSNLILTLDSLYGSEFFFHFRDVFYTNLSQRLPLFDAKDTLTILNWGGGSGYDALHLANHFKNNVMVLSVEPPNSLYRCKVIQDLYEVYNVEFLEKEGLEIEMLKDCVDIFMGSSFVFKDHMKDYINLIQTTLSQEGYLTLAFIPQLNLSLDWVMSIHEQYEYNLIKDDYLAKLRHYGLSRTKYIGMDNGFVSLQKS